MCFSNGNDNGCLWIILIIILFSCCGCGNNNWGGNNWGCGCGCNNCGCNNCGCNNNCGCGCNNNCGCNDSCC